jgi:hypothetical protein
MYCTTPSTYKTTECCKQQEVHTLLTAQHKSCTRSRSLCLCATSQQFVGSSSLLRLPALTSFVYLIDTHLTPLVIVGKTSPPWAETRRRTTASTKRALYLMVAMRTKSHYNSLDEIQTLQMLHMAGPTLSPRSAPDPGRLGVTTDISLR